MIDYHYGHLAHDSREHAVSLLDVLAIERAVDAGWTPPGRGANAVSARVYRHPQRRSRRTVDARWTSIPPTRRLRGKRTRTVDPLLTIRQPVIRQPVAATGNEFGLFMPFAAATDSAGASVC
jgi:hypothetical protein